ncbi:hypothetical protein Nepgr_021920 [Nepenthes gracilis]|uniref:GATA-type domain-containing protein n=1 Tax=Nepenthes gracilis TaxID=150966 RepID=A0AAD3SZG1_NEPGR|nr:hypothetical protein Nepgr_021920 [Nepenthes gracilis]
MGFCGDDSLPCSPPPGSSPEHVLPPVCSDLGSASELFPHHNNEVNVSLEWLSTYVEDCLSSTGNCLSGTPHLLNPNTPSNSIKFMNKSHPNPSSLGEFAVPGKTRSKRRRPTSQKTLKNPLITWSKSYQLTHQEVQTLQFTSSDPPLLRQSQWLAESELIILPRNEDNSAIDERTDSKAAEKEEEEKTEVGKEKSEVQWQGRRCSHCQAQRTPQWRAGPLGPKTLCNACGVRFKSGRLFPQYRPAKSPTFVSCLHSNSHKKVLQLRMALLSSSPSHH